MAKDPEKQELLKKLGIEDTKKNWTKAELQDRVRRIEEEEKAKEALKAKLEPVMGPLPEESPAEMEIPDSIVSAEDPFNGLTDRQRTIARLRLRNISQSAIAKLLNVTQPLISVELKAIREWQMERGKNVNQAAVIGETTSIYSEVENRAWELYYDPDAPSEDKFKALGLVMQAREKQTKLLMEVGLIRKASQEVTHKLEISPFLEKWKSGDAKKSFGDTIVSSQLTALAEPTLDDIEDAVLVEADPVTESELEDSEDD